MIVLINSKFENSSVVVENEVCPKYTENTDTQRHLYQYYSVDIKLKQLLQFIRGSETVFNLKVEYYFC